MNHFGIHKFSHLVHALVIGNVFARRHSILGVTVKEEGKIFVVNLDWEMVRLKLLRLSAVIPGAATFHLG